MSLVLLDVNIGIEAILRRCGIAIIWAQLLIARDIAWRACHDNSTPLAAFYVYQCLSLLTQLVTVVSHILQWIESNKPEFYTGPSHSVL